MGAMLIDNIVNVASFIMSRKYPVPKDIVTQNVGISDSSFYRAIKVLRSRFGAQIEFKKTGYVCIKKPEFPNVFYGV
jgi:hypothetical protein